MSCSYCAKKRQQIARVAPSLARRLEILNNALEARKQRTAYNVAKQLPPSGGPGQSSLYTGTDSRSGVTSEPLAPVGAASGE